MTAQYDVIGDSSPRIGYRRSPDNRATHQQRQRQLSRGRFIAAMRSALSVMSYADIAVEDIAARAQLSRATFYKHFSSKFEVALVLHTELRPRLLECYRPFAQDPKPDLHNIMACVDRLVDFYQSEREVIIAFSQMMVMEPEFIPVTEDQIREILDTWAYTMPSLALISENSPRGEFARIDARLMLNQLNDFCYAVAIYQLPINRADGLRIMARNVCRFFEDQAELGRRTDP